MEKEDFISPFKPFAKATLVSTGNRLSVQSQPVGFRHTSGLERMLNVFLARVREQLDIWDGTSSLSHRDVEDSIVAPLKDILGFLKEQGLIGSIRQLENRYNDVPAFFRFNIEPMYRKYSTDGGQFVHPHGCVGYGFNKHMEVALSKAIGEFLERYFLTVYHKSNFVRGSYDFMTKQGYPAISLDAFAGVSDEQKNDYSHFRWDPDSIFSWQEMKSVTNQKNFFIPAQYVFWNYLLDGAEPRLVDFTTNGGGGMFSADEAMLSGLYEIIQRDSFLIHWLNTLSPPKINPASVSNDMFQVIFQESRRYGFRIHCLNITADTEVPSFAVVVEDPSGSPRFSLGGGCNADPAKALCQALEEAWAVYHFLRRKPIYLLPEPYIPFRTTSINRDKRLRLWANPGMADKYSFLISGKETAFSEMNINFPATFISTREELQCLVERVENLGPGYEVYCHSVESPILSRLNYHVVKMIVPQMVPLYLNETRAPLGAPRLKKVPLKLGRPAAENVNPWPHPFP